MARGQLMEKHETSFNINGKHGSQLSVCCANGCNFKLHPTDISDLFPIPTFVLALMHKWVARLYIAIAPNTMRMQYSKSP